MQNTQNFAESILTFIDQSPTPFHAVQTAKAQLAAHGYKACSLSEGGLDKQSKFFISQNDSSLIAVSINAPLEQGFKMIGAHTDSPCLKVKPNATVESEGYRQLAVEVYGGALLHPWFDRDLGLAGRVTVKLASGQLHSVLIDFKRAVALIPSLAIHLNRKANSDSSVNKQDHLPAVLQIDSDDFDFNELLLAQIKMEHPELDASAVLSHELSLYDVQKGAFVGFKKEFVATARLDNLLSSAVAIAALTEHHADSNVIIALTDHEEVGSKSASGAAGPLLKSLLESLCGTGEQYHRAIEQSMMLSVDNAHAVHPNFASYHEPDHQPMINQGPVIKINHNQRYASNSETQAYFIDLCQQNSIPFQQFVVRSDLGCGSTIGPVMATELGIKTLDIGAPQWAMHSIRETAGVQDVTWLLECLKAYTNQTHELWS